MKRLSLPKPLPIIKGKIIILRPPNINTDVNDYFEMNTDPDMHFWTNSTVLNNLSEAKDELIRYISNDKISFWVMEDIKTRKVMGRWALSLEDRDGVRVVTDGNRVAKKFWRKGHNKEARKLILNYIFNDLNADILETGSWKENINSIKSIEACGYVFDREEKKFNKKFNRYMVRRYYLLLKEEWLRIN